jgi:hypothetical protein
MFRLNPRGLTFGMMFAQYLKQRKALASVDEFKGGDLLEAQDVVDSAIGSMADAIPIRFSIFESGGF